MQTSPRQGIFLVYYFLYQQVENNALQSLTFGQGVKLHPLSSDLW